MNDRQRAHLARCRAVLNAEYDPWRKLWNESDNKTRAMFCVVGGQSCVLVSRKWDDLGDVARSEIKRRAADLKKWLSANLPDAD